MFEFSQTVSAQDQEAVAAARHRRLHGPAFFTGFIFSLLIPYGAAVLAAFLGQLYFLFRMPEQAVTFFGSLLLALLGILIYLLLLRIGDYLWRLFVLPAPMVPYKRNILINDDGVQTTTRTGLTFKNWHGVSDIVVTWRGVFLYSSANGAFFLPQRLFDGEQQRQALVKFARKQMDHRSA